jgi:hypothetical protein
MNKLSRIISEEVNRFEGWFGGHDAELTPREEKFVGEFSKLSNDQLRELLPKLDKQTDDNYEASGRNFDYYKSEENQNIYAKENLIKKLIENRYWETKKKLFFGQPFLGSTIIFISTPDYDEDQKKALVIYLANDTAFEYSYGGYASFRWDTDVESDTSGDYKNFGMQFITSKVNPSEAILTTKELGLLNKIIRYNNIKFNKIPLVSTSVTTKDAKVLEAPKLDKQDFQWLVGLGDKDKISEVDISNNTNEYGGFNYLYITVGESWFSTIYTYFVSYDENYKIKKDEFKSNMFGSRSDAEEVGILDSDLYTPMMKAITQINPKSKYLSKVRRYTR